MIERDLVAEQEVFALSSLIKEEGSASAHDLDAVVEEVANSVVERENLRLAVVDGEEDHGEALLHGGVLEELVEDNLLLGTTLELDDDAHAVAVALVANVGDVVDDLFVGELGDTLDEVRLVDLVRDLGDDDRLAAAGDVLGGDLGAHDEASAAGVVGLGDAVASVEEAAGGEVGAFDMLEDELDVGADVGLLF